MIDIQSGIAAVLKSRKKAIPQHVNRISALDDPCVRRLYYQRVAWDKVPETDDGLQGVFETGKILEPVIERIVLEVGMAATPRWRIVGTQTPTSDNLLREFCISGTIDGFLQVEIDGEWVTVGVIDIKTMSPNVYARVTDYDALSRYPWTRKYRGQLMLYALAHNRERCFVLLVNKSNLYDMRLIDFPLDMAYCDGLLAKARAVNDAIAADEPPARLSNPAECQKCRFLSVCCPDIETGGNLRVVEDENLEAVLDRLAELEPASIEISDMERERDAALIKGQDVVCGSWLVTWKSHKRQGKDVWRKEITKG